MAKDARFIMGVEQKRRFAFCFFIYATYAVKLSILTSKALHVSVCLIHLKMCCLLNYWIGPGWWNMPTLFRIQNLKASPLVKIHMHFYFIHNLFFQQLVYIQSNQIKLFLFSALCRAGDAGSGLPSCRTGFVWQKVDREGLHAGRSSRPLWDVTLWLHMSATVGVWIFVFP